MADDQKTSYVPPSYKTPEQKAEEVKAATGTDLSTKDMLKLIAATGLRVGGQWGGSILGGLAGAGLTGGPGAIPGAMVGGAAGAGLSEALAEQVEPNAKYPIFHRPVHMGRVGVSSALGAIPGSAIVQEGRPIVSGLTGAGLGYTGVAANKLVDKQGLKESLDPTQWSKGEVIGGPLLGGA